MLNDIFGLFFEVLEKESAGLFHDSVDAVFTSKEIPLGFNILDFQGLVANKDYTMVESLLENIPQSYILVQINHENYLTDMLKKIS